MHLGIGTKSRHNDHYVKAHDVVLPLLRKK